MNTLVQGEGFRMTILLREQQQQVGERQAVDICTYRIRPFFHQLPSRLRRRRHCGPGTCGASVSLGGGGGEQELLDGEAAAPE